MYIFSAFNGHMKVLFCLAMIFLQYNEAAMAVQCLDLCDPDIWLGFLAEVSTGVQ